MGLLYEALHAIREPVIAPGIASPHALLNDCPLSIGDEKEGVMIDLISVLDQGRAHLGGHFAGMNEIIHLPGRDAQSIALLTNIYGRFRRCPTLASGHAYAMDFRT